MHRTLWAVLVLAAPALAQPEPDTVTRANAGPTGLWTLRSQHVVWGMPRQTDNRHNVLYPGDGTPRPGLTVLVREGFVVGHYDALKVPAWVCVRWTRENHQNLQAGSFGRPFGPDEELPRYARAGDDYDNATSRMERGHMARHEDNEAWGKDNSDAGCRMSNIVPQHEDMNGEAWNDLENLHQRVVVDPNVNIDTVWIVSGPVFRNGQPESLVGNGVAVPMATYKVIGWFDQAGEFQARGYVVKQEDRVRNDPAHYLVRIDDIEQQTGLDFFPDLPTARAAAIESALPTDLWGSGGGGNGGGPTPTANVMLHSLLPNPPGDETQTEAVTVRNHGTAQARLDGWLLRDRSGKTWALFGAIDGGDERTFLRAGQAMALNNTGPETVELVRPDGTVADRVGYDGAAEGAVLLAENLR
jgi:endonuclease G